MQRIERLFPEVFIAGVKDIFSQKSAAAGLDGFDENLVDPIIGYMRKINITSDGVVAISASHNLAGLLSLIAQTCENFKCFCLEQNIGYDSHPFTQALELIQIKIEKLVNLGHPKDVDVPSPAVPYSRSVPAPETKEIPKEDGALSGPEESKDDPLFPDYFVNEIRAIFKRQSQRAGLAQRLINSAQVEDILNYMGSLRVNALGVISQGVPIERKGSTEMKEPADTNPYRALLTFIDLTKENYTRQHSRLGSTLPFIAALDTAKATIKNYVATVATSASIEMANETQRAKAEVSADRWRIARDVGCVTVCVPYTIPQQIFTLFNCCGDVRIKLAEGDVHYWDAPSSIGSLCEDISERSKHIDAVKLTAPMRQKM